MKRDENKWKKEIHPELTFILNLGVEVLLYLYIKRINFFLDKVSILYHMKTLAKLWFRKLSGV